MKRRTFIKSLVAASSAVALGARAEDKPEELIEILHETCNVQPILSKTEGSQTITINERARGSDPLGQR